MTQEDYCSFEVAKLLKEKGFDVEVNTYFISDNEIAALPITRDFNNNGIFLSAPTHQMAMKWLREERDIFIQISAILQDQPFGLHYIPSIQDYHAYARHDNFSEYITYEEAVKAACLYSLKNLI